MTRTERLLALLLLAAAVVAPLGAPRAQQSAEMVLLDKANYWRLKDRPDLVAEALNKLLEIDPNNPEALYQYGLLSVQLNKPADAQRYLARLQQVAAGNPHIADLQAAIRAGKIAPGDLSEARRLAQAGDLEQSVQKYQEVFKGPPPANYGIEYYMTLAGTPEGWDQARQGMERLAQESPNDPQIKLSLGELYTYREPTRSQGIAILARLSKDPVVGANAVKSWRQALTWLGGTKDAKSLLQQYMAQYPQDAEIQQLLTDLNNQSAASANEDQSKAYDDLNHGNLSAAERQFTADLKANPGDPSALAGLGLVRLKQQRFTDARDLLGRAIKAAPDQQKDLQAAYDSAVFWSRVDEAKRAAAGRNYAAARAILTPLLAHPRADQWGAEMVLADIETKSGRYAAAEAAYRQVLRWRPGNFEATMGLANALRAQNKTAELTQLTSRMSPAERARFEKSGGGGSEAEKLRNEAKDASANGDTAGAVAKFKAAIAADPKSPWIRLDYARFLAGQGDLNAAYAVVDPAATGSTPTSVMVSAMFDAQQDRWVAALDKVNSIPPKDRNQDIRNFRDRIYVRGTIEKAKQLAAAGQTGEARNILVKLYSDPTVHNDEKRFAIYPLVNTLNDYATALQVTHDAYLRGGPDAAKAGADYVSLLLQKDGNEDEAARVLAQLNAGGQINSSTSEDLKGSEATLAIRRADKLTTRGDYADAWDQISKPLADNPDDTGLLLMAGRIYAASGRSKEAMEYFDKAYQQDSSNIDVLRGVISGAIQAHEYDQAQTYLDKAMEADPQNAWLFYLKAQIDRARGRNGDAVEALRRARELNQQQTGSTETSSTASSPASSGPTPLVPDTAPPKPALPPNPFRHSQLIAPSGPRPPALREAAA